LAKPPDALFGFGVNIADESSFADKRQTRIEEGFVDDPVAI
jgi:hypothetical protein